MTDTFRPIDDDIDDIRTDAERAADADHMNHQPQLSKETANMTIPTKIDKESLMSKTSDSQARPDRDHDASLLFNLAEAVLLGYPVLVLIGEVPDDERDTEVLGSSHFEALDPELQQAFVESAIPALRATI